METLIGLLACTGLRDGEAFALDRADIDRANRLLRIRGDTRPRARVGGAPLVGRGSQLRMLADAFANTVAERSCGLFTSLGTAGVKDHTKGVIAA